MEGLLQHQNSTAVFHKNYKRCMWDWLRIFDLHHRITVGKLLDDSSHGGRLAGHYYVPLRASEDRDLDDEANLHVSSNMIVSKGSKTKSSGKALVSSFILKKLFRKHHRRLKSAAPRLTRTNSIHHLECNDYVLPVEATSECDFVSENTNSSERNEYLPQLPGIKKCGTMRLINLVGQTELKHFTQDLVKSAEDDALSRKKELVEDLRRDAEFQFHDDSFLEMIDDSDLVLENILNDFHRSRSSKRLLRKIGSSKSVYFPHKGPTNDSPNLLHASFKSNIDEDAPTSEAAVVDDRSAYHNSDFLSRSSLQFTKQVTHSSLKKSLKGANDESRKEHLHISMDGLLHKVPYGQTVSEEFMKEKLLRSASARSYTESTRDNVSIPQKVYPSPRHRRSHSLSESDIFSRVLEFSSTREYKSLPESLVSTKVDISLTNTKPSTFRSFSCKDMINGPFDGTMSTKAAAPSYLVNKNEAVDIPPADPMSGDNLVNVEESVQPDGNKEQILDVHDDGTNGGGIELLLIKNELTEINDADPFPQLKDQQEPHIEHEHSQVHELPDSSDTQASHITCEHELQVDSSDGSIRPSPTSVLELDFEDDLFRPAKYEFPEDSEIDPIILNGEKVGCCAKANISDEMDSSKYDSDEKKDIAFAAVDNYHTHLDQKDEADFNYVRNVLRKSCFNGFEFLADPTLFQELTYTSDELESASSDELERASSDSDHQILYDLTNEILVELSERFSICSLFTRFGPRMRTMSTKCNVLEEVWKKTSVHLSSQTVPANMNEFLMAQDFAKDDGWLNLRQDAASIGMEIESHLLDDLLEELAFEHLEYI